MKISRRTYFIAEGTLLNVLCWPKWEGNIEKHIYISDSLCCTVETNTTCKATCLIAQSCPTEIPCFAAHQASLFMVFPRQEYWNTLLCPSPENILDPGIKPSSNSLQADSLPLSHLGNWSNYTFHKNLKI